MTEIVNVEIPRVADLRDLWLGLHRHHREICDVPLQPDDDLSWHLRSEQYREAIDRGEGFVLAAEDDGELVGYVTALVHTGGPDDTFDVATTYGEIYSLVVAANHRSKGIGTQLFRSAVTELERRGAVDLKVGVMAANPRAISFYERQGLDRVELELWKFARIGPR